MKNRKGQNKKQKARIPFTAWLAAILLLGSLGVIGASIILSTFHGKPLPPIGETQMDKGPYLYSVARGDKWGYMDAQGNIVIPAQYDLATVFQFGHGTAAQNGYYALIGENGPLTAFEFDQLSALCNGRILALSGMQYGYLDENGAVVVQPAYDSALDFSDGLAAVCIQGKWGYIDQAGDIRIDFIYSSATSFSDGMAVVWQDDVGFLLINRSGRIKTRLDVTPVNAFSEGLMAVADENGAYGFINTKGKVVIDLTFNGIDSFYEGLAAAESGNKWGYINQSGEWVVEPQFDDAWRFSEGYAPVQQDGLWGYIDTSGNWAIKPIYGEAYLFTNGLAPVMLDGSYQYVRSDGTVVSPKWE